MISTLPIGTIYRDKFGLLVVKHSIKNDAVGSVEVYSVNGIPLTYATEVLTVVDPTTIPVPTYDKLMSMIPSASVQALEAAASKSDGSTASYYQLPTGANQLQDLISHRNMNAQMGEIFRATYRYGLASHSDQLRDAKKIKFYAEAEIKRLEKLGNA